MGYLFLQIPVPWDSEIDVISVNREASGQVGVVARYLTFKGIKTIIEKCSY